VIGHKGGRRPPPPSFPLCDCIFTNLMVWIKYGQSSEIFLRPVFILSIYIFGFPLPWPIHYIYTRAYYFVEFKIFPRFLRLVSMCVCVYIYIVFVFVRRVIPDARNYVPLLTIRTRVFIFFHTSFFVRRYEKPRNVLRDSW